jgi:hypothetical protein
MVDTEGRCCVNGLTEGCISLEEAIAGNDG